MGVTVRRWRGPILFLLAGLAGCGGGSPPPDPDPVLATYYALLESPSVPGRRAALALDVWDDGFVFLDLTGQPGWGPTVATAEVRERGVGGAPVLEIDLTGLLSAVRPVHVDGGLSVDPSLFGTLAADPASFDVVLRDGMGAEVVRGPLGTGFGYELGAVLTPPSHPGSENESVLALRVVGPASLDGWITQRGAGAPLWQGSLVLRPPVEVSPTPLWTWSGVAGTPDPVSRVRTSAASSVPTSLLLWLWVEPEACAVELGAVGSALGYEGTLGDVDLGAWGPLAAAAAGTPRAGIVLHADALGEIEFALAAPPPPGASLTQVRVLRTGNPAPVAVLDLDAPGVVADAPGVLHGTQPFGTAVALALLAGQTDLTFTLDDSIEAGTHAGTPGVDPVRLFSFLQTAGGGGGAVVEPATGGMDLYVVGAGEVTQTTFVLGPEMPSLTSVALSGLPGGALVLDASPALGQEAVEGFGEPSMPQVAALLAARPGIDVDLMEGATPVAAGPLDPTFLCADTPYIPPFEGLWIDEGAGDWQFLAPQLPVSCGVLEGFDPDFNPITGTFEGTELDLVVHRPGGDVPFAGTITGDLDQPGSLTIVMDATDGSGEHVECVHDFYRWPSLGVWRSAAGDAILVVSGGFSPDDPLSGTLRTGGLDYPFTGARSANLGDGFSTGEWTAGAPPGFADQSPGNVDFYFEATHESVTLSGFPGGPLVLHRMTAEDR